VEYEFGLVEPHRTGDKRPEVDAGHLLIFSISEVVCFEHNFV
jgi:hypothetical protein